MAILSDLFPAGHGDHDHGRDDTSGHDEHSMNRHHRRHSDNEDHRSAMRRYSTSAWRGRPGAHRPGWARSATSRRSRRAGAR